MYCKNKFLITENERKHILSLYNLITEEEGEDIVKVSSKSYFDNGKWKNLNQTGSAELNEKINRDVKAFLQKNQNSIISIKIISSESRVTNYDAEEKTKVKIGPGELAKKRAETMKRIIDYYLNEFKKLKLFTEEPFYEPFDVRIGTIEYEQGVDDPNDPKYDQDRFVEVEIRVKPFRECLLGLQIEVLYNDKKDTKFKCRGGHQCDNANFYVKINGVTIGTANLNNKNDGGSRSSSFVLKEKEVEEISSKSTDDKLTISLQCTSGKPEDCHNSTPEVRISKNNQVIYHECTPYIQRKGETGDKPLLVIDACGRMKEKGDESTITNVDNKSYYTDPTVLINLSNQTVIPGEYFSVCNFEKFNNRAFIYQDDYKTVYFNKANVIFKKAGQEYVFAQGKRYKNPFLGETCTSNSVTTTTTTVKTQ